MEFHFELFVDIEMKKSNNRKLFNWVDNRPLMKEKYKIELVSKIQYMEKVLFGLTTMNV